MSDEKVKHGVGAGFGAKVVGKDNLTKEDIVSRFNEEEINAKPTETPVHIDCDFPDTIKLGEDYTVKFNKEFLKIKMEIYQGETVEKIAGNSNIIFDGEEDNKTGITYNFFNPNRLKGKILNSLIPGKYLVKIHAYGYNARDEHIEEKIIEAS